MHDDEQYVKHVMVPLARGEGVAAFRVVTGDGRETVVYATHRLSGHSAAMSVHPSGSLRAWQAVAIQQEARRRASVDGLTVLVP